MQNFDSRAVRLHLFKVDLKRSILIPKTHIIRTVVCTPDTILIKVFVSFSLIRLSGFRLQLENTNLH